MTRVEPHPHEGDSRCVNCHHMDYQAAAVRAEATALRTERDRYVEALEEIATEGTTTDREIAAKALGCEDWEHFDRRDL